MNINCKKCKFKRTGEEVALLLESVDISTSEDTWEIANIYKFADGVIEGYPTYEHERMFEEIH